jgi:hypothetical protein
VSTRFFHKLSRILGAAALLACLLPLPAGAAFDVSARLSEEKVEPGGVVSLIVTVTDPGGTVADPQFQLPSGLDLLGTSRNQQSNVVNGRTVNQVTFRYEIASSHSGRFPIGPIRVAVAYQTTRSLEVALLVTEPSAPARAGPAGRTRASGGNHAAPGLPANSLPAAAGAPSRARAGTNASHVASLVLSLEPSSPVVGQMCRLRVQLIQRANMSEDSQYDPPSTPGFWSENWSDLSRYEAREGTRPVIVTESALRLYPLAPGPASITPAHGVVTPTPSGLLDPYADLAGIPVQVKSESLRISVRPLPANAPAAFDGGVGTFDVDWNADRSHTSADQAITARLDVRGTGNLPLLRAPAYAPGDFEVFSSSVDDSLPAAGTLGRGRRSFVWTLLPRHAGHLKVSAPTLVWFDPSTSRYVTATPGALDLDVLSARAGADGEDAGGLPAVFRKHPARPGGRAAWPLLALLGGVFVAAAVESWRRSQRPDPAAPERARQREWLRAVGLARGPDFWRTADEVALWLERRGAALLNVRETIAAARFGGRTDREADVRSILVEELGASIPPPVDRRPLQAAAAGLATLGVVVAVLALPRSMNGRLADRAAAADERARAGDVAAADAEWARLWEEAPGDPALAARLAWSALGRDDVAAATVWTLRGDRREARDPAIEAVSARVRDAGGLVGAPGRALPFRSFEWALFAFLLAAGAGLAWPRRSWAVALAAGALVAGAWWPAESAWRAQQSLAVVRTSVPLPPTGVTLDSGQVLRVRGQASGAVAVQAASDLAGTLPASAVWLLGHP